MHLVALNIIMWIRTLIKESIEEIIEFESEHRVSILLGCRNSLLRCHPRWVHSAIIQFQTGRHTVSTSSTALMIWDTLVMGHKIEDC